MFEMMQLFGSKSDLNGVRDCSNVAARSDPVVSARLQAAGGQEQESLRKSTQEMLYLQ
jgi:hypothetical protein